MFEYIGSIEYLIEHFLTDTSNRYYFPKKLNGYDINQLLTSYIDSENSNVNYLSLISEAQSTKEFPIDDVVKLKAKKKYEKYWEEHFKSNKGTKTTISVKWDESNHIGKVFNNDEWNIVVCYDKNWFVNNLDYRTVLNNFIFVLNFTDFECRCNFISRKQQVGTLESIIGVRGKNNYFVGIAFKTEQDISHLSMRLYYYALLERGIFLEDVIKYFFETYLVEEFGIQGFVFNPSTVGTKFYEKHKNMISEMEGVLKQYTLYLKYNEINHELLEITSSPIVYENIQSMIENKYVYSNGSDLEKEMNLWFSDQVSLSYTDKTKDKYKNLYELISDENMRMEDFLYYQQESINWLCSRGSIFLDSNGILCKNLDRCNLLYHLYHYEVVCSNYHRIWKNMISDLVLQKQLKCESKLFSKPEVDFINFMLNKSEFNNGYDLRNKYSHGTYSKDENEQEWNYIELLKIMILIVIKINEEFCLKFPSKELNVKFV